MAALNRFNIVFQQALLLDNSSRYDPYEMLNLLNQIRRNSYYQSLPAQHPLKVAYRQLRHRATTLVERYDREEARENQRGNQRGGRRLRTRRIKF